MYLEGTLLNVIMGPAFRIIEFSSQNDTVGFPFYKMLALFLVFFLAVLYFGQHPWSRCITEIRTPSAPPQSSLFQ
jgi:hypothetical protein